MDTTNQTEVTVDPSEKAINFAKEALVAKKKKARAAKNKQEDQINRQLKTEWLEACTKLKRMEKLEETGLRVRRLRRQIDDLEKELIWRNRPMVIREVGIWCKEDSNSSTFQEFEAIGMRVLTERVRKWDIYYTTSEGKHPTLLTYVQIYLRPALKEHAQKTESTLQGSHDYEGRDKVRKAVEQLQQAGIKKPTTDQIREVAGITQGMLDRVLLSESSGPIKSLDEPTSQSDGDGATRGELLPAIERATQDIDVDAARIHRLAEKLTPREFLIVSMSTSDRTNPDDEEATRFAITGAPKEKITMLASLWNEGRETTRRCRAAALRRLGLKDDKKEKRSSDESED